MTRRVFFLIGLLLQLLAIFGLFLPYVMLLKSGTEISLRTVPVDPRSIFRGDYVMLDYEVGNTEEPPEAYGEIYIVLEKKGEFYERVSEVTSPDVLKPGQVCLGGVKEWGRVRFPDIAQYYVEEGLGRALEQANTAHRLIVDAVVDKKCNAVISGIRLGAEVPESELPVEPRRPEKPVPPPVETSPAR